MKKTRIIVTKLETTRQKDWALRPFDEYLPELEAAILKKGKQLVWYEKQEQEALTAKDYDRAKRNQKAVAAITKDVQLLLNMLEIIKRLEIQKSAIAAEHFKEQKEAEYWKKQATERIHKEHDPITDSNHNISFYDH